MTRQPARRVAVEGGDELHPHGPPGSQPGIVAEHAVWLWDARATRRHDLARAEVGEPLRQHIEHRRRIEQLRNIVLAQKK